MPLPFFSVLFGFMKNFSVHWSIWPFWSLQASIAVESVCPTEQGSCYCILSPPLELEHCRGSSSPWEFNIGGLALLWWSHIETKTPPDSQLVKHFFQHNNQYLVIVSITCKESHISQIVEANFSVWYLLMLIWIQCQRQDKNIDEFDKMSNILPL